MSFKYNSMRVEWRNRLLYWALALVPGCGIPVIGQTFGGLGLLLYLLFYVFSYRPLVDSQRLISLGAIEEKDAWRFFVPLQVDPTRYLRQLWLG